MVGKVAGVVSNVIEFTLEVLPLSSIVIVEFCNNLPVVVSKRAIALSVAELGPTTSPDLLRLR